MDIHIDIYLDTMISFEIQRSVIYAEIWISLDIMDIQMDMQRWSLR